MKRFFYAFLCALLLLTVPAAFGQGWAFPSKTPNTSVLCTNCPGVPSGSKTVGYGDPISTFVGRYLDSQATGDYQVTFRTARAWNVMLDRPHNRIYFRIGSAVFGYNLDTFFTRLASGETPMTALNFPTSPRNQRYGSPETFLKFDSYFYAEYTASGWDCPRADGQDRLNNFDVDDQGYVYIAAGIFGWGIVKDPMGADVGMMTPVFQRVPQLGDMSPAYISVIKGNGGQYYALVSDGNGIAVWNVTDRLHPLLVRSITDIGINSATKNAAATQIGLISAGGTFNIFTSDALISGGNPLVKKSDGFRTISTDGTNYYTTKNTSSGMAISTFSPNGATYKETVTAAGESMYAMTIQYSDGYLTVAGTNFSGAWDLRVYKVGADGVPTRIQPPGYPLGSSYFSSYYYNAPSGYVAPSSAYMNITDGIIYKSPAGKTYLIICAKGLGDVYEIKGSDSISVVNGGAGGTLNPRTPTASNSKTFYGDPVKVTANAGSSISTVSWNFGNPEALQDNVQTSAANTPITYQYRNLTKATLGTKTVTASNLAGDIRGTATVQLDPPAARFGITGTSYLFTQPNASSPAPIIVGDTFFDGSDGRVESHYASWNIDGNTTAAVPTQVMSAGGCGTHSLVFQGYYGPYTGVPGSYLTTGTNYIQGLDANSGAFNYTVRPFASAVELTTDANYPTANYLAFRNASRFSTDPTLAATLQQIQWKWDLVNASNTAVLLAGPTGSGMSIANFGVLRSYITANPGAKARLTLTSPALATNCAGLETSTGFSVPLTPPDFSVSGFPCTGPNCSFAIVPAAGADTTGWTYAWTVSDPTAVNPAPSTVTTSTYAPVFLKTGTFTITASATNAISTVDKSQSVGITTAGSLCGNLNPATWSLTYTKANGTCYYNGPNCKAGDELIFSASALLDYDPRCAQHTFTWSFGDGTSGTSIDTYGTIKHTYSVNTTYSVTLKVNNGSQTMDLPPTGYPFNVTLSSGVVNPPPPPPPPPPTGCGTMSSANVFAQYATSGASGCTSLNPSVACKSGEAINFQVTSFGYDFTCGTHQFAWNFGDGTTGTGQSVNHSYGSSGTYTASATVYGPNGNFIAQTTPITVTGGTSGGSCGTMTNANVIPTYIGTTCGSGNPAIACSNGESIAFRVDAFTDYSFNCGTHSFSWSFGDGATGTGQQTSHAYSTAGPHNVSVSITNPSGQNFQKNFTVTTQAAGGTGQCQTIIPNLSLWIDYSNPSGTCGPLAGGCSTGDALTFTVKDYAPYNMSCAPHTFDWDYGDGSLHGSGNGVTHQYANAGTYTVKCSVNNGSGPVTLTQNVTIGGGGNPGGVDVTIDFSYALMPGVPNGYVFTATADPADVVKSWTWNWGDSTPNGTGQVQAHVFADNKTYNVTVTAYDAPNGQGHALKSHTMEVPNTTARRRGVRH